MAQALNKSRIRNSKLILLTTLLLMFITKSLIPAETYYHETIEYLGYFLIAICALGRIYSTAFLGGHKNQNLITYGAFSVVRNPLYFFSLLGMTGVALISGYMTFIIIIPVFFIVLYHFLIKREEGFLLSEFGDDYAVYIKSTPRLIPNLKLYNAPETIEVQPKFLGKAFKDAIWWFVAFPVIEMGEYLHETGILPTLFTLP